MPRKFTLATAASRSYPLYVYTCSSPSVERKAKIVMNTKSIVLSSLLEYFKLSRPLVHRVKETEVEGRGAAGVRLVCGFQAA